MKKKSVSNQCRIVVFRWIDLWTRNNSMTNRQPVTFWPHIHCRWRLFDKTNRVFVCFRIRSWKGDKKKTKQNNSAGVKGWEVAGTGNRNHRGADDGVAVGAALRKNPIRSIDGWFQRWKPDPMVDNRPADKRAYLQEARCCCCVVIFFSLQPSRVLGLFPWLVWLFFVCVCVHGV